MADSPFQLPAERTQDNKAQDEANQKLKKEERDAEELRKKNQALADEAAKQQEEDRKEREEKDRKKQEDEKKFHERVDKRVDEHAKKLKEDKAEEAAKIFEEAQVILKEAKGETNIPVDSVYWSLMNRYRALTNP